MTPRLIAIDAPPRGQIGIQKKPVVKGTVHIGVTHHAFIPFPGASMNAVVLVPYRRHMALAAEDSHRLFQQEIVLTAVRRMAFHAPAAFDGIGRGRLVLVKKRAGTLRMALCARPRKTVGQIIVDARGEPVTAKTGYRPRHYRMIGNPDKSDRFLLMAGDAKIGVIILKQRPGLAVNFMAGGTIHLHFRVGVKAIVVQIIAPYMTLPAYPVSLIPGQLGRIVDIVL